MQGCICQTTPMSDSSPALSGRHPFRGVMLFICALLLFSCLDVTVKYLATRYNVPLVVAMRYIVHCLLMVVILAPRQGKRLIRTHRTGLVLLRAVCLMVVSLFVSLALRRIPVAEVTSIQFLAPMLVVLLAGPVLGEKIGALGWVAAILGFAGVLLVARPGGGLEPLGVFYVLCGVAAGVVYQLLSRILISSERPITMLFYTASTGAVCFGALLPWFWTKVLPSPFELLLFFSMGVTGGLGHYLFTLAYRDAPASLLAPVNYLQMLWAGLLGWLVFAHVPDGLSILGMVIIAVSGGMVALKSRFSKPA